jgi:isopentenyl-diphosphate Delta-isomerase
MEDTQVILVDVNDTDVGVLEKLRAHAGVGILHRAVSVLVFRGSKGQKEILLQKRSSTKTLWPGFWTNTVCTHPQKNESYKEAGARRLREEMGIIVSPDTLAYGFQFEYQAKFSPEFAEHELDTVLFLSWDGDFHPNPKEADDSTWVVWDELLRDIQIHPSLYTPWFRQIVVSEKTRTFVKTV